MKVKIEKFKNPILLNSFPLGLFNKDYLWAYHPLVIKKNNEFYMFYTGRSLGRGINHHLLLAKSKDLKNWKKTGHPILNPGKNKSWDSDFLAHAFVFKDKEKYFMLYDGSRKDNWLEEIGLAESSDLINWEKYKNNPIFKVGTNWWEKRHVSRCCVYFEKGNYYLFYAGHDGNVERIGIAKGKSLFSLKRIQKTPVLDLGKKDEWDEKSISDPRVFKFKNKYLMLYSGIDKKGIERAGLAESSDLIHWNKYDKNPILDVSMKSWDKISACRADVKKIGNDFYIFYSGRKKFLYSIGVAKLKFNE